MTQTVIRTGILIEVENNLVKETSLGVMAAASGHEIYALVLSDDVSVYQDKLAEYGAHYVVSIKGIKDDKTSPDLVARMLVNAIEEYRLKALLGTAGVTGKDLFARVAAILGEPLISDCVKVDIEGKKAVKSHFSGKTFATLKVTGEMFLCTVRPNAIEPVAALTKLKS